MLAPSWRMTLRRGVLIGVLLACAWFPGLARASASPSLESAYGRMYSFDFAGASRELDEWTASHPDDPLGPASQAASLLVSELSRLGILEAQFFASDASFTRDRRVAADPDVRARFEAALKDAAGLADSRLRRDAGDPGALFSMALVSGLRADYAALIEQKTLASLSHTHDAVRWANRAVAVAPQCADARLATGISEYVVGSLVAPLRWGLRLGGYSGDKSAGIEQVRFVAEHGRLLAPLARILLSIAYVREGDRAKAGAIVAGLCRDFPANPLFAREMRRLNQGNRP